ncbi:macrophage mannose receptor 1-like isoform X2 [Tachysurus fulvidraco]|uniref:macrophage mannose receptor 1-like isoform X2 n=1 Tax=Tachysurus fulvidraco TaxID=1234273 RepID=UPI001FEEE4BB|nr:macrophage mannose receptor 1-like isoform X2 [Tachysurus fulvidraco]
MTRKYYLVQQKRSWTDAQIFCRATHTDLAIIRNSDDMFALQNEAQAQNFSLAAWIGMYSDVYAWRWTFENEPVGNMRFWDDGEPNNRNGDQNCGAVTPWGWWDLSCTGTRPFLCFDETKTLNDRYIYVSNKTDWFEARAYCKQYHTDLASPRDENENVILEELVPGVTWFGMFKDPWKWIDNTNFSYVSWMDGEPDNDNWNETCGYLDTDRAADSQCSYTMPFFCYSDQAETKRWWDEPGHPCEMESKTKRIDISQGDRI